jgi:hypothetical protein
VKIWVMSDLHIEFFDFSPPKVEADAVVLAGDILNEHYGVAWARRAFPNTPIVYVLGNHEFYGADYETVLERTRKEGAALGVNFLNAMTLSSTAFAFLERRCGPTSKSTNVRRAFLALPYGTRTEIWRTSA